MRIGSALAELIQDWKFAQTMSVTWHRKWNDRLETALSDLPEMDGCTHDLYRSLAVNKTSVSKRIALISRNGAPAAVAAIRKRNADWVPVTHYLVPGAIFPVRPGLWPGIPTALRLKLSMASWRQPEPAIFVSERFRKATPTYKMGCADDMEKFWRRHGHLNDVKRMRRRCADFEIGVNVPGAAEWTIRQWYAKWNAPGPNEYESVEDRLLVVRYLENQNRHITFSIRDMGKLIGGNTCIVHHNELVGTCTYRDPAYDWYGLGIRMHDFSWSWAAAAGYNAIDMGGAYAHHKLRWGPQDGTKWEMVVHPEIPYRMNQVQELFERGRTRLVRRLWGLWESKPNPKLG